MIHLNKEQVKAVNTTEGNLLIVASAGTGKTTTIVERYVNLVTKHGYKPDEVLMTTFTNKAAKDMIRKISARTEKIPKYAGTNTHPIKAFIDFFKYESLLHKSDPEKAEDKSENIDVLIELFKGHDYTTEGVIDFLDSLIEIEKKEDNKGKVVLSTIHSAKGLEWKHVFLACCNDGILPFYTQDLSILSRDSELRLFYVAISRAKDCLTITHSEFNGWKELYPSEFLEIIQ